MVQSVGGIGIEVIPIDTLLEEDAAKANYLLDMEEEEQESSPLSGLAHYIISVFHDNRMNKIDSGIEDEILDSLRQFNGEYTPRERDLIAEEGGSDIYMNLTATKARAAKSWIADIYQSAKGKTWELDSTAIPDLPSGIIEMIETSIQREFQATVAKVSQEGVTTEVAQETIREVNQLKRDIREAISTEISKEASFQMKKMERKVTDQLQEGKWDNALLTFLDDFVVYPTAFLKGPVVSKKNVLTWESGQPVIKEDYVFLNERVDPLDIYPSAGATTLDEGNLVEHMRYTDMSKIADLKGTEFYRDDIISKIIEENQTGLSWFDTGIEQEKADQERRGNFSTDNDVIHGIHYFGRVKTDDLMDWDTDGIYDDLIPGTFVEVEAILIGNEVIKVLVNKNPVIGRPYHKASFINRPGSFWGRSLPTLMRDIQRMCNAAARALANNMALASGPSLEVYVDRLADDGEIEKIGPRQIIQLKSDPTGAGGRAIQWNQPISVAGELLKVYEQFELRADDVTGIPKYAYGNEKLAGAGTTASGLAMLLESASKVIKDAVRNIDEGLIKPRVEYQFYYNLLNDPTDFTGDIKVLPRGSSVLTTRAFEALRRNEFLQLTTNEVDQKLMQGGRAELLRTLAEDLGLPYNIVPTAYEVKKQGEKEEQTRVQEQQMMAQNEQARQSASIQATQIQIEGQERMAKAAQEIELMKAQLKKEIDDGKLQIDQMKLQLNAQLQDRKSQIDMVKVDKDSELKEKMQNKEIALKLKVGQGI